jgi:hypothetical protein
MMEEHTQVVLTTDLPEYDLKAGDVGVVVHVYADGEAYELEIFTLDGHTLDVVTVKAAQVRPASRRDVLHVRQRSA